MERVEEEVQSNPTLLLTERQLFHKKLLEYAMTKDSYLLLQNSGDEICLVGGLIEKGNSLVLAYFEDSTVVIDEGTKSIVTVNGAPAHSIKHEQILSLSDEGDRWEGDVLNDEPFGWGVLYDKEGRRAYEGFRIGELKVCYGVKYYADIEKVEYAGEWCDGKRWGKGTQYDRNGDVVFEGEWVNSEPLEKEVELSREKSSLFHNRASGLIVPKGIESGFGWIQTDLDLFHQLQYFVVGDNSLPSLRSLRFVHMHAVERIVIGEGCFTEGDGQFHVNDCPELRELKIGHGSFTRFAACEIEGAPSLEAIEMGDAEDLDKGSCFRNGSLILKSTDGRRG